MSGAVGGGGGGGAGAVVRQGHLRKLKTMKKKFFVLRAETADCSARLEYYESEKKFRAGATPRRVLPLKSCYNITRRLDLKQKHVIALFTREEQFCIVAENEQDLHTWLSALLKQHHSDDASEELLHPIQHVWQVNVQKKGLGAVKNIHGLYNLCLTDKTLTLVKIKSHNNVISELGIPERVEYSLKNIRRCGDSECFFYMEVGRQTATGAGEIWMHSDDSNIAQSMHSTIYHAMRNCAKETENERDHIVIPKNEAPPARRQTYSDGRGRAGLGGLAAEKGLCVGACIRQCVCASATYSIESAAALAPPPSHADYQPNNTLTDKPESARVLKHHRTVSLPTGCPLFQEPLKIVHERTRSAPLTGEEVDRVVEKALHSSCKAVNGTEPPKKSQCARRASTGMRLSKLSPAHAKHAGALRSRCDSMPSRACAAFDAERPPLRHNDLEGLEVSRDETDAVVEWYRTPRIPEEPDVCDISKDMINMSIRPGGSYQHSRTSSTGVEEGAEADGYLAMAPREPDGYLPMAHGLVSASSGSVCSGTPSTDPRFSEYQLDPATSHIGAEARPPRAYSVGSRPAPRAEARHRAYSVGARARPAPAPHAAHPRASAEDLMLLDFSNNSPAPKPASSHCVAGVAGVARTPPHACARAAADEYVDMSPRNAAAGYVEMRPGEPMTPAPALAAPPPPPAPAPAPAPDGYVEMTYGRTRPIAIAAARAPPPAAASPDDRFRRKLERGAGHGSQIFEFSGSLESPLSPPGALGASGASCAEPDDEPMHLPTVREAGEDARRSPDQARRPDRDPPDERCGRAPPAVSCSPQYVTLKGAAAPCNPAAACNPAAPCNPTALKCLARPDADNRADCSAAPVVLAGGAVPVVVAGGAAPVVVAPLVVAGAARFTVAGAGAAPPSPSFTCAPLHYAALDLEPRRAPAQPAKRTYTQIDFVRSEKLHAADAT